MSWPDVHSHVVLRSSILQCYLLVLLWLCLPSDDVQYDLQRWSLMKQGGQSPNFVSIFHCCEDNNNNNNLNHHPIRTSLYGYTTVVGCWYVSGTHVEIYQFSRLKKTKISWFRCTWCQRPGTTNHPHHLARGVTFFLPRPQHLTKTLLFINQYNIPPPFHFDYYFAFRVVVDDFCLFALDIVADVC